MVDRLTNRSRCFGFITMRDKEDIDRILASEQIVDGKRVESNSQFLEKQA